MPLRSKDKNLGLYGRSAQKMPLDLLPKYSDVDLSVEFYRQEGSGEWEAIKRTSADLLSIYSKTKIKTQDSKNVDRKIKLLRKKRCSKLKELSKDSRTGSSRYRGGARKQLGNNRTVEIRFDPVSSKDKLFDIATNIPEDEKDFYEDQLGPRNLRVLCDSIPIPPLPQLPSEPSLSPDDADVAIDSVDSGDDEGSEDDDIERDPDFEVKSKTRNPTRKYKAIDPKLFDIGDRYEISAAAGVAIHNLYNPSTPYTRDGYTKARKQYREQAGTPDFSELRIKVLGFDERKDKTRKPGLSGGDCHTEEHCSVIFFTEDDQEVNAGFFTPENGSGRALAEGLFEFCQSRKVNFSYLVGLCSDGCEKMVGWENGAHALFEQLLGRPLQRLICFFHHEERAFRADFKVYGYNTESPSTLSEPWKTLLSGDIHKMPLKGFKVLPNETLLSDIRQTKSNKIALSKDHEIFLDILETIITGKDCAGVFRKIGPIVHSRFTTTESRMARAYISTDCPPIELERMVHYLVYCWSPVYVKSKILQNVGFSGPSLLLMEMQLVRQHLNKEEFEAVLISMCHNGFFANHEAILTAMLHSVIKAERVLGVNIILNLRKLPKRVLSRKGVRVVKRKHCRINPNADCLANLNIHHVELATSEPPCTRGFSDEQLMEVIECPLDLKLPITSVAVERAVKDTTRAVKMVSSSLEANGVIQNTFRSRRS